MQKLQRLQWIPMFVKAINQARAHVEAQRAVTVDVDGDTNRAAATAPQTRHADAGRRRRTRQSRPPSVRRRKVHVAQAVTRKQVMRRMVRPTVPPVAQESRRERDRQHEYRTVIQELRQTRQRLSQLESISQQLSSMQRIFEERLPSRAKEAKTDDADAPVLRHNSGAADPSGE